MTQAPKWPDDIQQLLAQAGLGAHRVQPLPADASPRCYARVLGAGKLVMQDRDDLGSFAAFVRLSQHLAALGLSAPQVLHSDMTRGIALIEDFGTDTYGALLARGHDERALYALAVDALVHLHRHSQACAVDVPAYDLAMMLDEISRLSHWLGPELNPSLDIAAFDSAFRALWLSALMPLEQAPPALVLRDFHIDNLMLLPARTGVQACGLLDFQDAVIGAGVYDLASLLQDARRDLAPGLEQEMLDRYLSGLMPQSRGDVLHSYHLLAAQRHTRLMGQFIRLLRRDNKPGYLRFMPRVAGQMQTALRAAGLYEIEAFLDNTLPLWRQAGQIALTLR